MQAEDEVLEYQPVNEETFHPFFSSPDGDVILGAKDRSLFRVHSYTLKTTSGWFRSLFSMPQRNASTNPEVIHLDEDTDTLEKILRMICGLPIIPLSSYDEVDALLFAAEKYDMPGPMSLVRIFVMTPPLLDQPLRLYAVASRYGWESETKHASTQTLTINVHALEYRSILRKLGTDAILDLFQLHRDRREGIRQRLDQHPFVGGSAANVAHCPRCRRQIDHHTWRELKYRVILEMDVRPLGDTVINHGLTEWAEARACWEAKCPNPDCMCVLYDKGETLRLIRECIDGLPSTI
ncbi:hypothetical protein SERLA73DRAFT_179565 [Serpula lacrymans var. lacrymans S7.3]|uniref:BTB domain-containing protein n=2 Tax=Serpula lacrymans var. lacrymans TaxID=341189 RepID=F8PVG3_SERL3|nr:uncharacterized protein SERLADRAFT_464742 [Serpula lacrymans var. lacrymans S7.9]EGN99516.1 hypothetical protein SERLA73DRAFT_179565 [Serpula lacrymans var. lacrymans S7.3]EGO25092.1 hypothetical protein SERLADRAFT_464742 [Serpula lacrymans var. lacrymans S7.9]